MLALSVSLVLTPSVFIGRCSAPSQLLSLKDQFPKEHRMDVCNKPTALDEDVAKNLGPLTTLAGIWEGDEGIDISPSRTGPVETKFRERLTFEPFGPVVNGQQVLYGLRYAATAWPLGQEKPFHEEVGYWLWDPGSHHVMRCFVVPRGVTVQAGGQAEPTATKFEMTAAVGSHTFGITSNPFLDHAFKTVSFKVTVTIHDPNRFSYSEDTQLKIQGFEGIFHHTDQNTLERSR